MIVVLSKKLKKVSVVITIFLVLFGLFYFIFYKDYHEKLVAKRIDEASIPRTANGPWVKYFWQGKRYIYPPEWTLVERKKYKDDKEIPIGEEGNNVLSFVLSPTGKIGEDSIYIGGGVGICESHKYTTCVGNDPIYTNSRNSNVMIVFDTIVKSIKREDGNTQ